MNALNEWLCILNSQLFFYFAEKNDLTNVAHAIKYRQMHFKKHSVCFGISISTEIFYRFTLN